VAIRLPEPNVEDIFDKRRYEHCWKYKDIRCREGLAGLATKFHGSLTFGAESAAE
jgi:hypothetical protein